MSDTIGDLAAADFVAVSGGETVGQVSHVGAASWYVVTTDFGAFDGVVSAGQIQDLPDELTLEEVIQEQGPFLTMAAQASVEDAAMSRALRQVGHEAPGAVVMDEDDAIVGILSGGSFDAVMEAVEEAQPDFAISGDVGGGSGSDSMLAGRITIAKIIQHCAFQGRTMCGARYEFNERPDGDELPLCDNPHGLQEHKFVWTD